MAAVELALVSTLFFTLFFTTVEVARAMYVCNTLQEATRRGAALAANADFSSNAIMQQVRQQAVFRTTPGYLMFAQPVSDASIKIDYMWIKKDGASMTMQEMTTLPPSPAANHANCMGNPYADNCIRLVRVRVCQSGDGAACDRVDYRTLLALVRLPFGLPRSTTIVPAETLGMPAGVPPATCGCP